MIDAPALTVPSPSEATRRFLDRGTHKLFIGGEWVEAASGDTFEPADPATGQTALAIPGAANAIFFNAGQVCVAGSRLYAHRSVYDCVVDGVAAVAREMRLGHGLDPPTQLGPLVSVRHAEKVAAYISDSRGDGAELICGGEPTSHGRAFIQPTVVAGVRPDMAIVREEVFGPVMVVQPFDDIDEAVAAANDSIYGLAASVWTKSLSSAHRLARRLRAGTVWISSHSMYDASLPIGGVKQSGWGRDSGQAAIENYVELKTICAVI